MSALELSMLSAIYLLRTLVALLFVFGSVIHFRVQKGPTSILLLATSIAFFLTSAAISIWWTYYYLILPPQLSQKNGMFEIMHILSPAHTLSQILLAGSVLLYALVWSQSYRRLQSLQNVLSTEKENHHRRAE
jgi:hypothetical protein